MCFFAKFTLRGVGRKFPRMANRVIITLLQGKVKAHPNLVVRDETVTQILQKEVHLFIVPG